MTNPILLIDTWESGGNIDETILLANDVSGMVVRINDINGGHHMDSNFWIQWEQAKVMPVRIVYFVYNPWKNGQENYDWLVTHIPDEAGAVMLDVEVVYAGYSPTTYAIEFNKFYQLVEAKWNCMIYTGQWFLDLLDFWPANAKYWWAAYPTQFYNYETITWDVFKARIAAYPPPFRPSNENKIPNHGVLEIWQFTGDRIILPGCNKRMDVNVFYGTLDELKAFTDEKPTNPTPDVDLLLDSTEYYDGLTEKHYEKTTPHGRVTYNLTEIEIAKVKRFLVTPQKADRDYVPEFLVNHNLHVAVNGDGWTSPPLIPTGRNVSEEQPYGPANVNEAIWVSKENVFSITKQTPEWNSLSIQNRLIKDGVIPYIDKSLADIRARTAIGWDQAQTKCYLLTVDGGDHWSHEGLNFHETAALMLKLGCYQAVMNDGGASAAKAINDNGIPKIIGITCGADSKATLPNYPYDKSLERVVNAFGVEMLNGSVVIPPGGNKMYKCLISVKERPIASMYSTSGAVVNAGYQFDSTVTVTGSNIFKPADFGVTFVQLPSGGWLPMIYKGVEYVTKMITPPLPPPDSEFVLATLTRPDGSTTEFDLIPKV